ncbi:membrane protein [Virgisporangium aliadipatigenens]|uniref:Membrane protein n=1 Tax=Virgisporangium aliadipatigenens TaxID=741659 RepID=A0A8J4DP56_9ACTN|nr:MMPL family transporter [Virgisporangium aliadipatigenens]GIJ44127.1 membrane protein [Virgisporangium aliadipatigenens]
MATFLYRLGRASYRKRRLVLVLWIVALAALGGAAFAFKGATSSDFTMPGTESQRAIDTLKKEFPQASGATGTVVVKAPEGKTLPEVKPLLDALTLELNQLPGVVGAVDPFTSQAVTPDMRFGLFTVQFEGRQDDVTKEQKEAYEKTGAAAEAAGLRVEHGGEVMGGEPEVGGTEAIGVAIALVVLVVTFGSLVAAGMTMFNALIGVGAGMAGLFALSGVVHLTSTAPVLALMLGLAVGIDYSLFISSRHRQNLMEGLDPEESIGRAVGTAGSAVVFAGVTVVIALAGLAVVNIPFLTVMGLAAAATVAVSVLVAVTLLPALLGFAGRLILPIKARKAVDERVEAKEGFGFRWARLMVKLRIPVILVGVIGLGALAVPAKDMRISLPDPSHAAADDPARKAADLIEEGFGPGFNGRLILVVVGDSPERTGAAVQELYTKLNGTENLLAVAQPQFNQAKTTALLPVIPKTGPTDEPTEKLVHAIRDKARTVAGADVALTGATAVGIDVSEKLSNAMPWYLLLVVGLSVLLLMLVFRSFLVPVKAALGFLLTVGATFGVTVLVFQEGHLASLVGLDTPGPLISFLPILLIGILFGLAMDYEVFLVSRMREDFVHGDTATQATINGMGHGVRVVTAAALIMTSVFAGFVLIEDPTIKSMGFALAIGVAIDAFIVRMTIVPAVMSLLGRAAWWLPRPVDRILPNVDIEGEKLRQHLEPRPAEPVGSGV